MVSQPLNASRGRSFLPVQRKTATLAPRSHLRTTPPLPAGKVRTRRPQPSKSAYPHSRDPAWREHLIWWKQISTGMAIVSGLSVLSVYSWTVHTQSRWSQRYQVWQQMQRNERQFLLTQESIANSLREIADRSDMVPLVPERMIEVPIALPSTASGQGQSKAKPLEASEQAPPFYPVGY
ncbi:MULTISPECIES: hypothetical protein [unclassified Synechococcus]|jgi:hypothetical protein|uniref:hypothetical protein n=2 Tax=unclassified Synechococcus TaxID=2626047 RepID=UPI0000694736|nr:MULTISPECIES: hypothetical protein [unclassified Synechococcus]PIK87637.1 hypothetical protein SYN65AY6A5_00230 [Synechococcus sp. 65AY6A5]PIK98032.1 hypothetical protein SYN63AY4M1_07980 [Synechococcus sp. 63AY4M1]ABD00432.1 conserved hypothetical protein [Synechococcus sp. JA-3-3Ab]PIK95792.1 hypothetical protein SYN60AY4M2_10590 [Synechococcus sp. 60AY4M2]PIL01244.1 hypothetical protein SYN65AY640_06085 [Synechococcus sp. 65AY640]